MVPFRLPGAVLMGVMAIVLWLALDRVSTVDVDRASAWLRLEVSYGLGRGPDGLASSLAYELSRSLPAHVTAADYRGGIVGGAVPPPERMHLAPGDALLIASTDAISIAPLRDAQHATPMPQTGWCPMLLIGATPHVLVVREDAQIDSVPELLSRARRSPGALSYATLGSGSSTDAIAGYLVETAQVEMVRVPYRHSAAALKDVLNGDVTAMFATLQAVLPAIGAHLVRAIAVTGDARTARLPQVPTFGELGVRDLTPGAWYGLFAPCHLPVARQRAIVAASIVALGRSRGGIDGLDVPERAVTGPDFVRYLELEQARWRRVMAAQPP